MEQVADPRFEVDLSELTNEQAAANILLFVDEDRLVRHAWNEEREGRQVACLLGSMHAGIEDADSCPGKIMPSWLALTIPSNFDALDNTRINPVARTFAEYMTRWKVLADEDWNRVALLIAAFEAQREEIAAPSQELECKLAADYFNKIIDGIDTPEDRTVFEALARSDYMGFNYNIVENFFDSTEDLDNFADYHDGLGESFFEDLFKALDVVLPSADVKTFVFDVEYRVISTAVKRVSIENTNQARAHAHALRDVKDSISATIVEG